MKRLATYILIAVLMSLMVTDRSEAQAEWTPLSFENINMTLYDIHFTSDLLGWAVGERGTILHTSDGGESWDIQYQDENDELELVKLAFTSETNGVAVGGEIFSFGTILHTSDAGETWTTLDIDGLLFLESAFAADDQNIWAVGGAAGNQIIARSSDAGQNWEIEINELGSHALFDVFFVDGNNGWMSGLSGNYHRTTNGGESWSSAQTGNSETLIGLHMLDAENGFMASQDGDIFRTDNGSSWTKVGELDFVTRDIWFVSEEIGFAGVFSGLYSTTNGGADWNEDLFTGFNTVTGFHFMESGAGWAVGTSGRFWKTEGSPVSVNPEVELPRNASLKQNYPNPFNPGTRIAFTLQESMDITLTVYDVAGRMVRQIASGSYTAGEHSVYFDAANLPSGAYFYQLQTPHEMLNGKMMLIK